MKCKRITLTPGWLIKGNKIIKCHFTTISQADMWGDKHEMYIVKIEDCTEVIAKHKNDVFKSYDKATDELLERKAKHIKYCKDQIKFYQDELEN
jgi:hypothetical protein